MEPVTILGIPIEQLGLDAVVVLATVGVTFFLAVILDNFKVWREKLGRRLMPVLPYLTGFLMALIFADKDTAKGFFLKAFLYAIVSVAVYDMAAKTLFPTQIKRLRDNLKKSTPEDPK